MTNSTTQRRLPDQTMMKPFNVVNTKPALWIIIWEPTPLLTKASFVTKQSSWLLTPRPTTYARGHQLYASGGTYIHTYIMVLSNLSVSDVSIYFVYTYIHTYIHTSSSSSCVRIISSLPNLSFAHMYIHTYILSPMHTYIHTFPSGVVHRSEHTYIHTYIHTSSSSSWVVVRLGRLDLFGLGYTTVCRARWTLTLVASNILLPTEPVSTFFTLERQFCTFSNTYIHTYIPIRCIPQKCTQKYIHTYIHK